MTATPLLFRSSGVPEISLGLLSQFRECVCGDEVGWEIKECLKG